MPNNYRIDTIVMRAVDIDDLATLGCRKDSMVRYLRRYFIEGKDYELVVGPNEVTIQGGGHNKRHMFVTEEAYSLILSSYNLKHRYAPLVGSLRQVRTIMSLENQTIGFICSSLQGLAVYERQYSIGLYHVDLCFVDFRLVVECDENGHEDRDVECERQRESFIHEKGFRIIRFNPNADNFDLSVVLRQLISIVRP